MVVNIAGEAIEYRQSETAPPVIRVLATDAEQADWFDLGVTVEIDGEQIPFQQLFVALAREESRLVLDSGTNFSIDRPELDQLRRLIEEARDLTDCEPGRLRLTTYQAGLWEEHAGLGVVEVQSEWCANDVSRRLAGEDADPPPPPAGLAATLRPYQLEGYRWLAYLWMRGSAGFSWTTWGWARPSRRWPPFCALGGTSRSPRPSSSCTPPRWWATGSRRPPGSRPGRASSPSSRRRGSSGGR